MDEQGFFSYLIGDFDHIGNWREKENNFQENLSYKPKTEVNLCLFLCCGFFVHTSEAPVVVHHVVYFYTHFFHLWQNSHWLVHNVPFVSSQFSTNSQFSTKCPQFHPALCMQFKQIWMWHLWISKATSIH